PGKHRVLGGQPADPLPFEERRHLVRDLRGDEHGCPAGAVENAPRAIARESADDLDGTKLIGGAAVVAGAGARPRAIRERRQAVAGLTDCFECAAYRGTSAPGPRARIPRVARSKAPSEGEAGSRPEESPRSGGRPGPRRSLPRHDAQASSAGRWPRA